MSAILQIIILIMSAILHEVAHGFAALALGDPTAKLKGRLTLNPLAHLDLTGSIILPLLLYVSTAGQFVFGWAKPVPYNPYNLRAGKWGPGLVAIAGPGANLLLAVIFASLVRLLAGNNLPETMGIVGNPFISICAGIVVINVLLAIFNLLPVPPLDGSKLLFAILPSAWRNVEDFLNRYQLFLLLLVLFFGWRVIAWPVQFLTSLLLGL